jgi:hypothetical protein
MLFLVISHPQPERPSRVAKNRQKYWRWIEPKLKSGEALWAYPRVGRGVAAAFEVPSHEALHALLNEWAEMIPAEFEVLPLIDPAKAKRYLARSRAGAR